ncbi:MULTISPECIES: hypothetical protein [Streptomyces]|uniref:hypothetical protein n=1 Tax=Streptomyces TaxID=1883 RepID=UPI0021A4FA19|nr:hypothetical protein [Streptomyces atratus]MCT2543381.1 hypothetical protein [Streptomyces atratus]
MKFATTDPGIEYFTPEQVELLIRMARHARDRFPIVLTRATGMRIGETLGLRRADVHFLADSRQLGCHVEGPHVHVHRQRGNADNALAKSRKSRTIPQELRLGQGNGHLLGDPARPDAEQQELGHRPQNRIGTAVLSEAE